MIVRLHAVLPLRDRPARGHDCASIIAQLWLLWVAPLIGSASANALIMPAQAGIQ
jgi:hypothetical protein